MKKTLNFIIPVIICFVVGFIGSLFQSGALESWYPFLNKPVLTPPNVVFPIAWGILYLCMGISLGFILNSGSVKKAQLTALFTTQLFFNFLWSIFFFGMRSPVAGLADILILDILVIMYAVKSWPVSKAASLLFVPYILWVLFATYLNAYIFIFN